MTSPTQLRYLKDLAAIGGSAPAQKLFDDLRFSKLSLSRMGDAGVLVREIKNGKSHWTITPAGRRALTPPDPAPAMSDGGPS